MQGKENAWGSLVFFPRNPCLEAGHSRKYKTPILGKDQRKTDCVPSKGKCNALVWTFDKVFDKELCTGIMFSSFYALCKQEE